MTSESSATTRPANDDVIARVHTLLKKKGSPLAENFLNLKYIKNATGQPEPVARRLVNMQLRMHLGGLERDTSIARLALDDECQPTEYYKNFKQHTLPLL